MTRDELVELVRRIQRVDGSEEEISRMVLTLKASVAHPAVSDLIFWSEKELTAEEIVDEALAYEIVAMPPPTGSP